MCFEKGDGDGDSDLNHKFYIPAQARNKTFITCSSLTCLTKRSEIPQYAHKLSVKANPQIIFENQFAQLRWFRSRIKTTHSLKKRLFLGEKVRTFKLVHIYQSLESQYSGTVRKQFI